MRSIRQHSIGMVVVAALSGGFAGAEGVGRPPGEFAEVVGDAMPAVVTITSGDRVGAGVVVNAAGHIITSAHVVGGNDAVSVGFRSGRISEGKLAARNRWCDLAAVLMDGRCGDHARLGATEATRAGERVAIIGAPLGLEHSVTMGVVGAPDRLVNSRRYLQLDARLNPGNSGGPVVDGRGAVVGLCTVTAKKAGNVGFAVPAETIAAFLQKHNIGYHTIEGDRIRGEASSLAGAAVAQRRLQTAGGGWPLRTVLIAAIVSGIVSAIISGATCLLILRRLTADGSGAGSAGGSEGGESAGGDVNGDGGEIEITLQ